LGLSLLKLLDLLHRWTGGLIGLVLAVLGGSGVLLLHRDAWVMVPHAGDAQIRSAATIAAATEQMMTAADAWPRSILYASENFGLHRLSFGGDAGAYADQSGRIAEQWSSQWQRPEIWLVDLHHHLFAGETGELVVGTAGICGLLFVLTGVILWWRTRKTFEFRLLPKRLSRPAIVRHHRDLGLVMAPLLLLSTFTGSSMVFKPVSTLVLGPGAPAALAGSIGPPAAPKVALDERVDWRAIVMAAHARFPDAEFRMLTLPKDGGGLITIRMRQPEEWLPNGRTTLWFAADTGRLVEARDALSLPAQAQGYNLFYPLHAAKVGGLPYRLLMTLSGLTLLLLGTLTVWTFWFKRMAADARSQTLKMAPRA
jgi:uncharacterized iron-regulated membrane protein